MMCYFCGHAFDVPKRTRLLMCPKCRHPLEQENCTVGAASSKSIHTTGTFRLTAGGSLTGGSIVARDVILEGRVEAAHVRALRLLELAGGTIADESMISGLDLKIAPGASFHFQKPIQFRNVEIFGALRADLQAKGTVTVRAGGVLSGRLTARHLNIEDGAGLEADVQIVNGTSET